MCIRDSPKDVHDPKAPKPAEAILRLNKLFKIEGELEGLSPEQRKKERLIREKQHLEDFWSWAEKNAVGELPKSKLSTAFNYALNNRQEFFNYLEDGHCSISNSLAENCIRPFVIGRKTVSYTHQDVYKRQVLQEEIQTGFRKLKRIRREKDMKLKNQEWRRFVKL